MQLWAGNLGEDVLLDTEVYMGRYY